MALNTPKITIAGCGPGSPEYLTPAVINAAQKAEFLVGAKRLLDLFPTANGEKIELEIKINDTLEKLSGLYDSSNIVVLVSGDPGIHSLARLILRKFGAKKCRVIPGISSVQTAFAELGLDWEDCSIISAHKEDPSINLGEILSKSHKIAILGGRKNFIKWLFNLFEKNNLEDNRIFLLENLTLEDQRITEIFPTQLFEREISSRSIVTIIKRSLIT